MMKKMYIAPTTKVHMVIMPQLLAGSEIGPGGTDGEGHHGMVGNSMEADFEE